MTLTLNATKPISLDDLLNARLDRYDIEIVASYVSQPVLYLYSARTALRAELDENGNCVFVVPDTTQLPWHTIEALAHEFDCRLDRQIDRRDHELTALEGQAALVDLLGEDHLTPSDNLLRYLRGESHCIEPGKEFEKAEIARALVNDKPELIQQANAETLLILTDDIYVQRHPPFSVTLKNKNPVVAKLCAAAMLSWASSDEKAPDNAARALAQSGADESVDSQEMRQWLAIRKQAGLSIDAETAEVTWRYAQVLDPYGVNPDLPAECRQVGREYFARAPGSEVWVHFHDLPVETRTALWERHELKLAFPAGLPFAKQET